MLTCLLRRISNKDLILLLASPNARAYIVEGSDVQSEANKGVKCISKIL